MTTQIWKLCMVVLLTFGILMGCATTDDEDYEDPGIDAPEEDSDMQQDEEFDDENQEEDDQMQDEFDDEYDPDDNEDEEDNY
ncbi:hypothetical protein [Alkalibacillus haloalkaliphilus]|uniref:Lipoprotein n=1 Tax=Alkalibacillus haloalkaliphilus TaxID=94136 RepID=A0A511VZI5_9BACI|nr:hypothetical protein [Alkalibacillus haloalkaliphilus]GEN44247.1 hypothetical protein AHA02nite_00230 [Alkalibacillus haloalkaliphilus]